VFRNCLKFSEFVKASEIVCRRQRAAIGRLRRSARIEIILVNGLWPTPLTDLGISFSMAPEAGFASLFDPFLAERNVI
jgi:hypothetical protein